MRRLAMVVLAILVAGSAPIRAQTAPLLLDVAAVSVEEPPVVPRPALNLRLSAHSARVLEEFTTARLGGSVDVFIGEARLASVFIMSPIVAGNMMLEVPAGQDVEALARALRSEGARLRIVPRN